MAWSEADIAALEAAIKQGTVRVKFSDREITYRSLSEMMRLRDMMIAEVRGKAAPKSHTFSDYDRGYS